MRSAIALAVFLVSLPALSDELRIPASDVDRACGKLDYARAACTQQEQGSYEMVKLLWPDASPAVRAKSVRSAGPMLNSAGYYNALETYLSSYMRDERMAQDAANPPRFQR